MDTPDFLPARDGVGAVEPPQGGSAPLGQADEGTSGHHLARGVLRLVPTDPRPSADGTPAQIRPTALPGVVLYAFALGPDRYAWVPTHEASGTPLTVSMGGAAAASTLEKAHALVATLGSARWRGRPVDWRRSLEWLQTCRSARLAMLSASGFVPIEDMTGGAR